MHGESLVDRWRRGSCNADSIFSSLSRGDTWCWGSGAVDRELLHLIFCTDWISYAIAT
jgi:hypothetical protein